MNMNINNKHQLTWIFHFILQLAGPMTSPGPRFSVHDPKGNVIFETWRWDHWRAGGCISDPNDPSTTKEKKDQAQAGVTWAVVPQGSLRSGRMPLASMG